ncbi:MAG: DNA methyltransferase [Armatimonadia bacterium]
MSKDKLPVDEIVQGDCIDILKGFPACSVDLIFADPPYNLQLRGDLWRPNMTKVDAVTDEWDQFSSFEKYDRFTREWLEACRRVLKPKGTLWVIGTYHNIYRVGSILMDLGYWILNDVVWVKTNPMPNFRGVRFTNAHETLLWAKKSEKQKGYTFNHHAMKAYNDGKQMRSDWYLPLCTGPERIMVNGEKAHTTQKPEALLERVIVSSSMPGDLVLDPFFGTGTTGAVARRLGRHYIGIERDASYVEVARQRIAGIAAPTGEELEALIPPDARKPERVPFTRLLELGLLQVGDRLTHRESGTIATINADGTLTADGKTGSIHRLGAEVQGTPSCNGWLHWLYRDKASGEQKPLEALRDAVRNKSK